MRAMPPSTTAVKEKKEEAPLRDTESSFLLNKEWQYPLERRSGWLPASAQDKVWESKHETMTGSELRMRSRRKWITPRSSWTIIRGRAVPWRRIRGFLVSCLLKRYSVGLKPTSRATSIVAGS